MISAKRAPSALTRAFRPQYDRNWSLLPGMGTQATAERTSDRWKERCRGTRPAEPSRGFAALSYNEVKGLATATRS
jgi:hypothetical protein